MFLFLSIIEMSLNRRIHQKNYHRNALQQNQSQAASAKNHGLLIHRRIKLIIFKRNINEAHIEDNTNGT